MDKIKELDEAIKKIEKFGRMKYDDISLAALKTIRIIEHKLKCTDKAMHILDAKEVVAWFY
jgi:hypothetical protein